MTDFALLVLQGKLQEDLQSVSTSSPTTITNPSISPTPSPSPPLPSIAVALQSTSPSPPTVSPPPSPTLLSPPSLQQLSPQQTSSPSPPPFPASAPLLPPPLHTPAATAAPVPALTIAASPPSDSVPSNPRRAPPSPGPHSVQDATLGRHPRPASPIEPGNCTLATFVTSDWGPCNATCGFGVQTRTVACQYYSANLTLGAEAPEALCSAIQRPLGSLSCILAPCPTTFDAACSVSSAPTPEPQTSGRKLQMWRLWG